MFDNDLANNPATALTVGTAANLTFTLQSSPSGGQSKRSVASVATTSPHIMTVGHSTRAVRGLKYAANKNAAPDVIVDRHLIRVDKHAPTPTLGYSDPSYALTYGAQLVVEVPRLGADTPATQLVMDQILRLVVALNPSSSAGLIRFLNWEL